MPLQSFRDLRVWQQSIGLVRDIYIVSAKFPKDERFGLTAQIRRAAVSVPSNIAEGYGRVSRGEYVNQLSVARGSLCEVTTLLDVSEQLGFASQEQLVHARDCASKVGGMLWRLMEKLRK